MISSQGGRVHQALRRATAAAHRALDHHPLLQRLMAGGLTREQYAESLAAMYRPHVRLEQQVHGSPQHFDSGLKLSTRVQHLEADLSGLGWPVPSVAHTPPDPLEGRAAWWGRVYVLEGSRQGGLVIARQIRSSLGPSVPCRFFGEATEPGSRDARIAMCERELENCDELDLAIASACAAFADYQDGLDAFDVREVS